MSDDSDDFDVFFRHDFVALIAFLRKAGFGREEAEDAAAEAMTCVYEKWHTVTNRRAWVRTAAYRIAVGHARRVREGTLRAITEQPTPRLAGVEQYCEVDEQLRALSLLALLPDQQRLVLAWHLDGFDSAEIAEKLEIPRSTVRSNLRHARARLKQELASARGDRAAPRTTKEVPERGR